MMRDMALLVVGLALIIKGGDWFVAAAVRTAELLRMPRMVIGSTLVSLATTTPELVVSIMAGARGESGLAVGNAVGSCICNIGLILGVTAAMKHVDVHPKALRAPLFSMLAAGTVLFWLTLDLQLDRWQGVFLILGGMVYFFWDFWTHWRDRRPQALQEAGAIGHEKQASGMKWLESRTGTAAQFAAGAVVVVVGSRFLVDGAVDIAARLGIPSIVIGLTVVAVGTSLPELVTAITSSRQSVSDLAVGNVLGANIANLTFIVGAAAILEEVSMTRLTQAFNFPAMLLVMVVLAWMLSTDRRITRREGAILLACYAFYGLTLIALTLWAR